MIILALLVFSCKKDDTFKSAIYDNNLSGSWGISFMDDGHLFLDSIVLVEQGFGCNLVISREGEITVYSDNTQDTKVAEWEITEMLGSVSGGDSLSLGLKMKWPDKYKYIYFYKVSTFQKNDYEYINLYTFTPVKTDTKFVFFNNKNLGTGLTGSFCFSRQ